LIAPTDTATDIDDEFETETVKVVATAEEIAERRAIVAQERLLRAQDGELAMSEHLAGIEQEREKTARLREARMAREAAPPAAGPKAKAKRATAKKA
jgi:hypothetical protein